MATHDGFYACHNMTVMECSHKAYIVEGVFARIVCYCPILTVDVREIPEPSHKFLYPPAKSISRYQRHWGFPKLAPSIYLIGLAVTPILTESSTGHLQTIIFVKQDLDRQFFNGFEPGSASERRHSPHNPCKVCLATTTHACTHGQIYTDKSGT